MAYAERTEVAFEKSIGDIMKLLRQKGCDQIGQMESQDSFAVAFSIEGRMIRIKTPLTLKGSNRGQDQQRRQRGRALLLVIKAKFESVESGIETVEQAFLPHILMADGRTVHERIRDDLQIEYQTGRPTMGLLPDHRRD